MQLRQHRLMILQHSISMALLRDCASTNQTRVHKVPNPRCVIEGKRGGVAVVTTSRSGRTVAGRRSLSATPATRTQFGDKYSMKDFSLFLLKNSLAAKMKRGIRSFCSSAGATSTMNQRKGECDVSCIAVGSSTEEGDLAGSPLTLEQMLLQLDEEEAAARVARLDDYGELHRRMSCVNNSDILRSARNALDQYPRFSLDGRDAMYRSSFRGLGG